MHCGFCLPACPTYLATGDESDSPRGRIVLMRALERGDIPATDPALVQHLDACLGCLGCEPVCPSGVGYGRGIQTAREQLFARRPLPPLARAVLGVFRHDRVWRPLFSLARLFRSTSLPRRLAGAGRVGFGLGMVAATEPWSEQADALWPARGGTEPRTATTAPSGERRGAVAPAPTVALFRGCVMDTLFRHVHEATRRTLEANGYRVIEPEGQVCCGALHEHAGDRAAAEALARRNAAALADAADFVVVNSAGCGALLKGYDHLLGGDGGHAGMGRPMHGRPGPDSVRAGRAPDQTDDLDVPSPRLAEGGAAALAARLAAKVRDVAELLAERGPRPGAALPLDVAYDAPCHLQHAQRVQAAPLAVLAAIPGLRLQLRPSSDKCCGSAGIYSVLRPAMARAVLDLKIEDLAAAEPRPAVVATGNPGCLMQIGAGLRAAGLPIRVAHPVELLDESYRRAGLYANGEDATADIARGEPAGAARP